MILFAPPDGSRTRGCSRTGHDFAERGFCRLVERAGEADRRRPFLGGDTVGHGHGLGVSGLLRDTPELLVGCDLEVLEREGERGELARRVGMKLPVSPSLNPVGSRLPLVGLGEKPVMPTGAPSPPYGAYGALVGAFAGGMGSVSVLARLLGRRGPEQTPLNLVVLGLAAFKAARTVSHDEVTSFIRRPFVKGEPDEPDAEEPLESGDVRQALGELLTCTRCTGVWTAAGVVTIDVLAPRLGRVAIWSLALAAVNDWLEAGFAALTAKANVLEQA
jgi:uncharacterized protein DUF1360